jgi:hypothetical protein
MADSKGLTLIRPSERGVMFTSWTLELTAEQRKIGHIRQPASLAEFHRRAPASLRCYGQQKSDAERTQEVGNAMLDHHGFWRGHSCLSRFVARGPADHAPLRLSQTWYFNFSIRVAQLGSEMMVESPPLGHAPSAAQGMLA